MKVTDETIESIRELYHTMSDPQIAEKLGCSTRSVLSVRHSFGMHRTKEESSGIRSRNRIMQVKAERRRAIFGLDQKTCLKVFSNRERNILKSRLKRKNYLMPTRGGTIVYFDENTIRNEEYENKGVKLGLSFMSLEII